MEAFFYTEKLLVIEAEKNKTFYIRFNLTLRTKRKNKLKATGIFNHFFLLKKNIYYVNYTQLKESLWKSSVKRR